MEHIINITSSRLPSAGTLQIINDKSYTLRHFTCCIHRCVFSAKPAHQTAAQMI